MAKKKSHEEEIQRGLEELGRLGISVESASPGLIPSLREQLGKGRQTALAAAFALGRIAEAAAVKALADLERTTTDKAVHREIRRSLYKLAQKGLHAPAAPVAEKPAQKPVVSAAPEIEGYLSSVDGAGGRLVWLAKAQAGSGVQLLQGMVSDRVGLAQAGGAQIRRKELRRMADEIKSQHGVAMISIPWEYGDRLLCEGFEKARALGRGGLDHFSSLRAVFNPGKPKSSPHPVYSRLQSEGVSAGAWRELSRRLLDEPEFRLWILDEDWMRSYLERAEQAQESRLVLNQMQKEERLSGIVRDAVKEIFFGGERTIFQRRMEDMALYLLETAREEPARLALAVALQLGEKDPGPLDISFLTGWAQKSLAYYIGRAKSKAAEEPSLIVKP